MTTLKLHESAGIQAGQRLAVIAGGGSLPVELAEARKHHKPLILMIVGEVENPDAFSAFDSVSITIEQFGQLASILLKHRVTHVVSAGTINRRPQLSKLRLDRYTLLALPRIAYALAQGDNALLSLVVNIVEGAGVKVLGGHQVAPKLLAVEGHFGAAKPHKADWRDIEAARQAALAIGGLDIGQAAVSVGGRVIALEGIEGTQGLLHRVAELRQHGRLAGRKRGVLVKCAKPGQELRVDMPSIGPQTVGDAHAAGLAGIAVEAGRALVLEGPQLVKRADELGLFVIGLSSKAER